MKTGRAVDRHFLTQHNCPLPRIPTLDHQGSCQDHPQNVDGQHYGPLKETLNHVPLASSPHGSSNRNPPKRCPRPLYSRDSRQEVHTLRHQVQRKTWTRKKAVVEVETDDDDPSWKEESPSEMSSEGRHFLLSSDFDVEDEDITGSSPEGNIRTANTRQRRIGLNKSLYASSNEKPLTDTLTQPSLGLGAGEIFPCFKFENCFPQKAEIDHLQKLHSTKKPFQCTECGKCFGFRSLLVSHRRIHTGERPFPCLICDKRFAQKITLENHKRIHTGEKPYECTECEKCFRSHSVLIAHQKKHNRRKPFTPKTGVTHYKSEEPYLRSGRRQRLTEHQNAPGVEKLLSCTVCGKHFRHRSALTRHLRVHTGEKPFTCFECGKCFARKIGLAKHQRAHQGQKPFWCGQCGKRFQNSAGLARHQMTHSGEKVSWCLDCLKCFKDPSALAQHQESHTEGKSFECAECGKIFSFKSMLVSHERSHSGERPFSCTDCGKTFLQKAALVTHLRIHTGEKPFRCSECGKQFTQKGHLAKHEKTHV
ncbi:gastrula zinc finger protein XlCGF57.1-like [Rana temporaria]|uniref:gastrula zinc finger protein XlCGF57.1-like n=1 Tax=Rana temporaria TaxID=8407 RepID=UPI001AAC7CB2|nr:gastrula zinc finger protein XlCGF57.1-like [Rana temporaria]